MRKLLLFFIALLFVGSTYAQLITITEANQIPVLGQMATFQKASTFGFEPAGEGTVMDKLWDFAMLFDEGGQMVLSYVEVSETVDGAMYPNATLAEANSEEEGYFYYEHTDGDWLRWGFSLPSEDMWAVYNSGATEFTFPITAGNSFSNSYAGDFSPFNVGEDSVKVEDGSININADAQGTLILPTGTFEDVLRVRVNETFKIVVYMLGTPVMSNTITDEVYYWFHEDHFKPILMYYKTYMDGDLQDEVLRYQVLDIEENLELTSATGTDNQTVCFGDQIINITYSATGVTGANITGLPDGVTSAFAGSTITIEGTPTEIGTFNYLIELVGGEEDLTAVGTITVNELPVVTCPDDFTVTTVDPVDLNELTVTPVGGVFSGDFVSDGVFNPQGLSNGNYTIIYTYTDPVTGCENHCTFIITLDIGVGVTDNMTDKISVYPNPALNHININNSEKYNLIKFYDLTGREVKTQLLTKSVVDISGLPSGMYVIELIGNATKDITKIIIK